MTIRELAAILGLSKSTVAYALRNAPLVKAETREFVQRRARELGFVPNPVASAFLHQVRRSGATGHKANLAFLVPAGADRPYVRSLCEGACERSLELGYSMDRINVTEHTAAELNRMLRARGIL